MGVHQKINKTSDTYNQNGQSIPNQFTHQKPQYQNYQNWIHKPPPIFYQ